MLQGGMNFLSGTGFKPLPMLPPPSPAAASSTAVAAAAPAAAAASAAAGAGGAVEPRQLNLDDDDFQQFLRENPDEAKQLRLKMMKKRNVQG